ncbi:MAG: serine hydrolase domain-containing protein [Candidatus Thorarchaeota archaeon]
MMSEFIEKEFESIFKDLVDADKFSGVVLVAKEGHVIFERAYGYACKNFEVPNQMDTIFNIGSLNKVITKIAILQLLQKGQLTLDDLVGKHLPEVPKDIATKVKISHLISFTSGMGDYFNEKFTAGNGNLRTLDDFVPFFIDDPLQFEPGEKMLYSNAGYVVLGKIIEAVSGMNYYEYVKKNIYEPAGMSDTGHFEIDSVTPKLATGYTRHMPNGSIHPIKRRTNYFIIGSRGSSAGGGQSTVYDLLKLDRAIANEVLLDKEHSGRIYVPLDAKPNPNPRVVGLAGGAPGLNSLYLKFGITGHTVFVLANYDPEDVEPVVKTIMDMFVPENERGKRAEFRTKDDS